MDDATQSPLQATQLALGNHFTCALTPGGDVACWGLNDKGQLGVNATSEVKTSPTTIVAVVAVSSIVAGIDFACAQYPSGVACWGHNNDGQLANGSTQNSAEPVHSVGLSAYPLTSWAGGIRLGYGIHPGAHGCVTRHDHSTWCWGANHNGQLGLGEADADAHATLEQVTLPDADQLALGGNFSCARLTTGALRCWGRNKEGQLGIGFDGGVFAMPQAMAWPEPKVAP